MLHPRLPARAIALYSRLSFRSPRAIIPDREPIDSLPTLQSHRCQHRWKSERYNWDDIPHRHASSLWLADRSHWHGTPRRAYRCAPESALVAATRAPIVACALGPLSPGPLAGACLLLRFLPLAPTPGSALAPRLCGRAASAPAETCHLPPRLVSWSHRAPHAAAPLILPHLKSPISPWPFCATLLHAAPENPIAYDD